MSKSDHNKTIRAQMYVRRMTLFAVGLLLALLVVAFVLLRRPGGMFSSRLQEGLLPLPDSSERAFHESYLGAVEGKDTTHRTQCKSCHENASEFAPSKWTLLNRRSELSRQTWAEAVSLQAKCGVCHLVPDPSTLPRQSWGETVSRMQRIMESRQIPKLPEDEWQDILHFYLTFSPERWPSLAADPDPAESPVQFQSSALGNPKSANPRERPVLGHVQIVDLDRDGQPDVLVCDMDNSLVTWVSRQQGTWREETLAKLPYPAHTQVAGTNRRGNLNLVVACLGLPVPTEDPVGSVVLLVNDGALHFNAETILSGVGRVADVEPGDFDGDGDVDFVVGAYGYVNNGEIGWLENTFDTNYSYHLIVKRTGAIHVLPADLNGDGRLDFVALFAQEHEQISAFLNDGKGGFQEQVLFKAATPSFGSSGIQLVDLDGDGDLDILNKPYNWEAPRVDVWLNNGTGKKAAR